jgi:hypothetical protein
MEKFPILVKNPKYVSLIMDPLIIWLKNYQVNNSELDRDLVICDMPKFDTWLKLVEGVLITSYSDCNTRFFILNNFIPPLLHLINCAKIQKSLELAEKIESVVINYFGLLNIDNFYIKLEELLTRWWGVINCREESKLKFVVNIEDRIILKRV